MKVPSRRTCISSFSDGCAGYTWSSGNSIYAYYWPIYGPQSSLGPESAFPRNRNAVGAFFSPDFLRVQWRERKRRRPCGLHCLASSLASPFASALQRWPSNPTRTTFGPDQPDEESQAGRPEGSLIFCAATSASSGTLP